VLTHSLLQQSLQYLHSTDISAEVQLQVSRFPGFQVFSPAPKNGSPFSQTHVLHGNREFTKNPALTKKLNS
jgi:hypothetical protein